MSDLVWWTLFAVLTLLLVVLVGKLCYRVITDVWCTEPDVYSEEYKDIEDLTRYRTDFRTIFKEAEVKDESDKFIMTKEFFHNHKSEEAKPTTTISEKDESENPASKTDDQKLVDKVDSGEQPEDNQEHDLEEEHKTLEKSEEDKEVEALTEEERRILEQILGIKGEADIYARQIPYVLGGKNHLTYFEVNQNFIMNLIGLSSIDCKDNDKLKRRKQMVSMYIQECQDELKKRADYFVTE